MEHYKLTIQINKRCFKNISGYHLSNIFKRKKYWHLLAISPFWAVLERFRAKIEKEKVKKNPRVCKKLLGFFYA